MKTIEIHPYDFAELVERMDVRDMLVIGNANYPYDRDFGELMTDGEIVRYHPNVNVPRTSGKHWIW